MSPGNGQGPRSRKGELTRARLIDAARLVFERDGFLTARITDITVAAGMSQGSFYHYFESKEEIFREVARAQEERLTAPPEEPLHAGADDPVHAAFERDNRLFLTRYRDAAQLMGVIEEVSRYDAEVNAARMATQQHFVDRAETLIQRLQQQGVFDKRLDPRFTADALYALSGRVAEMVLVQGYGDYDLDHMVEQLTTLTLNALGVAPSDQSRPTRSPGRRAPAKAVQPTKPTRASKTTRPTKTG